MPSTLPHSQAGRSPRPRLLFVSPRYLFPADSGGKIRTAGILRGLRGGVFEVNLASPLPEAGERVDSRQLAQVCARFGGWPSAGGALPRWTRLRHLASGLPVAVATDYS